MSQVTLHPISRTDYSFYQSSNANCASCNNTLVRAGRPSQEILGHFASPLLFHQDRTQKSIHASHRNCIARQAVTSITFLMNNPDHLNSSRGQANLENAKKCGSCNKMISNLYDYIPSQKWKERMYAAAIPFLKEIGKTHPINCLALNSSTIIFLNTSFYSVASSGMIGVTCSPNNFRGMTSGAVGGAFIGLLMSIQVAVLVGCFFAQVSTSLQAIDTRHYSLGRYKEIILMVGGAMALHLASMYLSDLTARSMQNFSQVKNEWLETSIWCAAVASIATIVVLKLTDAMRA